MAIPTEARLVFSKLKPIEFSSKIMAANLNGYEIFVIQLVHIQDLCGDESHFCHFSEMSLDPLNRLFLYSFRQIGVASRYGGAEREELEASELLAIQRPLHSANFELKSTI